MKVKTNKHTLKKRISKIMFLCILITVLLFSGIITYLMANMFKVQAKFISDYFSYSLSQSMNSSYFLKQLGLSGLEDFDPQAPKAQEWIQNLVKSGRVKNIPDVQIKIAQNFGGEFPEAQVHIEALNDLRKGNGAYFIFGLESAIHINIILKDQLIYSNDKVKGAFPASGTYNTAASRVESGMTDKLPILFNTESSYALFNSKGEAIGKVTANIDSNYICIIFLSLVGIIFLAATLSLFIASIISRFFILRITIPLNQLDEKIKAIAAGDYESTMNAQITLKKPLREIESIAGSTNVIMQKMKEYNDLLESQNEELEAQNEELVNAKNQIQEAQAMLVQSEKMASIGQLTAAITHEINTPLGAISSNVQICDVFMGMINGNSLVQSDKELSELVEQMKEANGISIMACQRITEIIKSLKSFSKLDQAEFQEADINDCLKCVLVLTSNLWKNRISMHEEYGSFPMVKCFPGLLNQVFMNIIVNAIQAINDKGDIYIRTYADDKHVYTSIRDNGSGICEEHISRIFEPGFTTKGSGIGMGLGLSICYNIIKKHNGEIKVESKLGKGTEFIVCIPYNNK